MNRSSLIGHVLELFEAIDNNSQPADRIVTEFLRSRKYLGSHDRRFISESVFGMIRHRRFFETILECYCAKHPEHSELKTRPFGSLSLFATYAARVEGQPLQQISSSIESRWSLAFPHISLEQYLLSVDDNSLVDNSNVDVSSQLGIQYSFQDWMVREWHEQIGNEVEELLQAFNLPAAVTLRVNGLKATREECRRRLHEEGIETEETTISPSGLTTRKRFNAHSTRVYQDGWFELQDEGSQIVSLLANPSPGNLVIDACAGAGGKSLHLAELMNEQGEIIAIDVERQRILELEKRARRAGVRCITPRLQNELDSNMAGKADIVLVDAPCSGVGTIRRSPWLKWSINESLIDGHARLQKKILDLNVRYLKVGGRLLYTTCSLFRKENEDVVQSFLASHPEYEIMKPEPEAQCYNLPMTGSFITLYPHRQHTDGFFIAFLKRVR